MTDTLPDRMTAIAITEPGGPRVLKPERRPLPEPDKIPRYVREVFEELRCRLDRADDLVGASSDR